MVFSSSKIDKYFLCLIYIGLHFFFLWCYKFQKSTFLYGRLFKLNWIKIINGSFYYLFFRLSFELLYLKAIYIVFKFEKQFKEVNWILSLHVKKFVINGLLGMLKAPNNDKIPIKIICKYLEINRFLGTFLTA